MASPWQPRVLEPEDLPSALAAWAQAHPKGATCAGDSALCVPSSAREGDGEAHVVLHEGEPIGLGVARCWGRVGQVHGLIVAEPFRRRGVGAALLESLLAALARRDAAVIGVEVDSGGASALTFLARAGFRPMHLSFVLERAVAEIGSEDDGLELVSSADQLDGIRAIAASVDADFDPTRWLQARLAAGQADIALLPDVGFAVLPRVEAEALPESSEASSLLVSMAVAVDGPPHAGLRRLVRGADALARARGCARLQVAAPSRYWDATQALLDEGFVPRASFLRLTRAGTPERADSRRCYLTSWR